ncbi:MAG: RodZ domain-containing protein [Chloroflexota bacterium]
MPLSIGQRLRQAREYRLLSLEKAADITRIRVVYLQALENDDFSVMPSAAQGRGFLRNYAEFLDLDLDQIIAELQKEAPRPSEISGPLPVVDVTPAPAAPAEEPASPPFWTRFLPRKPKEDSTPQFEPAQPEPAPAIETPVMETPIVEEKPVKPRGRRKKTPEAPQTETPVAEIPAAEEKPSKPRGRRKKIIQVEVQPPVQVVEEQPPAEVIEEKKDEAETPPVEVEQAPVPEEAQTAAPKPSFFVRVASFFNKRVNGRRPPQAEEQKASEPEPPKAQTPNHAPSNETAEQIFLAIGEELRARRELISLTFSEVEQHTKVRAAFLKEMEAGAFDKLPSPVQTRGMLANYATFLDLDPDAILLRFADALQARHRAKYPEKLKTNDLLKVGPSMPPLRTFMASDLIFGVGMIVLIGVLAVWGVTRVLNSQQEAKAALPTAPSISDVLAGTPVPTVVQEETFVPLAGTQFSSVTQEATVEVVDLPVDTNIQVIVTVVERSFVRVSVDGEVVFDGRVVPGDSFTYEAEEQVSILTGNGAALLIKYNGRDLGLMGDFGQVVSQIYLVSGLATPTATLEPTATATPPVSPTPTATETSTPTLAPTATP